MRKRNVHIQFWLNRKEAEELDKKVKRSGLSRESYLRHLVNGVVPQDEPPRDYYAMMNQLHRIGINLNQIAFKANALNVIDADEYAKAYAEYEKTVKEITEAVLLPKPMK